MPLEVMQILWYLVIGASVIFYVMLDGFDLGVGALQIFAGKDENRRYFLNSIGPFWDGNEVWLIIIAGGLFVGFPDVYAVAFSGFYLLFMFLLCGIIFRAVAIEFRSKHPAKTWRYTWDFVFWISSLMITFGSGVILGNLIEGVPITRERELYATFLSLFGPYPILIGVLSIFLFAMHGNIFLLLKLEGALQKRVAKWVPYTVALFCLFFVITTVWTWISYEHMTIRFSQMPLLTVVPILLVTALGITVYLAFKQWYGLSFLLSMLSIALLFILFAIGTFPIFMASSIDRELYSLTLYNSSASATTLTVALVIAVIGVPLVLIYGWILYTVFHGKTKLHDHSY